MPPFNYPIWITLPAALELSLLPAPQGEEQHRGPFLSFITQSIAHALSSLHTEPRRRLTDMVAKPHLLTDNTLVTERIS